MTAPFGRYAEWYDAFNAGKDYAAEVSYLLDRVARFCARPRRWLDVGCGTGHHLAALQGRGIEGEGLDASAAMIARARTRHPGIAFHVGSLPEPRLAADRDVVSLLFHVVNYLATGPALAEVLRGAAALLAPDGVLVFDFWNAEALESDPPGRRVREAIVGGRRLYRVSTPMAGGGGSIDVRFEFRWDHPERGEVAHEEVHVMRPFDRVELTELLCAAGVAPIACEGWMTRRPLRAEDWYGLVCARPARIGTP